MALAHDAVPDEVIRPLKRSEYERLAELGAFADEKVELLYGRIVKTVPQGTPHAYGIERLTELFVPRLVGRARVRIQMPFLAPGESMPEPDVAVVPLGDALAAHPSRAYLVVEVAETSLATDRAKALLYALAGVVEYWIVDVRGAAIEVRRRPAESGYQGVTRHGRGEVLAVPEFADVTVRVDDVLPPA
jgi:Uma2 family endonuclease